MNGSTSRPATRPSMGDTVPESEEAHRGEPPDPEEDPHRAEPESERPEESAQPDEAKHPPSCPHKAIVALYHEVLPELPRVRVWGNHNRSRLQARWREDPERQNLDWWRGYFEFVRDCPWLMGQDPKGNGWRANLDWLVRPTNMSKVLNGTYCKHSTATVEDPENDPSNFSDAFRRILEAKRRRAESGAGHA